MTTTGETFLTTSPHDLIESAWKFFCSLRLTMFLLISLAATSVIGTLLPQGQVTAEYAAQINPIILRFLTQFGFFDMYHSWWFVALLCVFSLNLVCCSIRRSPHVLAHLRTPERILDDTARRVCAGQREITFSAPLDIAVEKLSDFLKNEFAAPIITVRGDEYHIFAQKNAWRRLSVYVVHSSILVIFAGAIIGSLFGDRGFVDIVEGEGVDAFVSSRSGKTIPLGFTLRCDQFTISRYPNGMPREFKSVLTVLEKGVPAPDCSKVRVVVNHPLTWRGLTFYQSGYGNRHYLTVVRRGATASRRIPVNEGEIIALGDGTEVRILETIQDVRKYMPGLAGPAAVIEVASKGDPPRLLEVFKNYPELNARYDGNSIFGYDGSRSYTGLQVTRDPGVHLVWLGCALMLAGLYGAFFVSHKRVWIVVTEGTARLFGTADKNRSAFDMQFDRLAGKLKKLGI